MSIMLLLCIHRAVLLPDKCGQGGSGFAIRIFAFRTTTRLLLGTLEGPIPVFYAIGMALAVPSWWIIHHTRRILVSDDKRTTLVLNVWLAATLLALGIHNLPLVAPGLLNIGYQLHSHRAVGWAIVSIAVVVNVGLFVGSVFFLMSGQSFEQFSGIE